MSYYSEKAKVYFRDEYNCAQAVVAAFCDKINIDFDIAVKLASSFGGGVGRLREICGAVSGMSIIAGLLYGYHSPHDISAKTAHYKLIQQLAQEFKEEFGTIICRELLGLSARADSPVPDKRTQEYYEKRPCVHIVAKATEILEKCINEKDSEK